MVQIASRQPIFSRANRCKTQFITAFDEGLKIQNTNCRTEEGGRLES